MWKTKIALILEWNNTSPKIFLYLFFGGKTGPQILGPGPTWARNSYIGLQRGPTRAQAWVGPKIFVSDLMSSPSWKCYREKF